MLIHYFFDVVTQLCIKVINSENQEYSLRYTVEIHIENHTNISQQHI